MKETSLETFKENFASIFICWSMSLYSQSQHQVSCSKLLVWSATKMQPEVKGSLPSKARGEKFTEQMWKPGQEIIWLAIV